MKTNENKKGISLIVLIITILVMIIIAAAIILNIDDTKIIDNADRAVSENNMAVAKEIRVTARAEWRINEEKLKEKHGSFEAYLKSKLDEAGIEDVYVSSNGTLKKSYTDKSNNVAIIPEGYVVSQATGEDTIADGLVIYEGNKSVNDSNVEQARRERNQFVWVPVEYITNFIRNEYINMDKHYSYNVSPLDTTRSYDSSKADELKEYMAMYNSVKEYKGFYIARYEAGTSVKRYSYPVETTDLLIQKDRYVYNFVDYNTMKQLCSSLTNNSVVGHLAYGEEWDAALTFIADNNYLYAGDDAGNYSGNLKDAGSDETYARKNIYDMSGNTWETTMEISATNTNLSLARGGYYGNTNSRVGYRYPYLNKESGHSGEIGSFRPALYLK